jgi:pimeloyl-ACP methyl ester carboxylesterase
MEVVIDERQVMVNGLPVTYRVAGDGDPVVLVHGLAGSLRWWTSTVPALATRYRVYLVDLPGFGEMRRFPGGFVLKDAAEWLVGWMRALNLPGVHLIGHSMGAYISLHLAANEPGAVNCMVLVDAAGVPTGRSVLGHVWPLMQETLLSSPSLLPLMVRDAMRAGPSTLWRAAGDLLAQDVRQDARMVQSPTLLVWGENDALVPPSLGYALREEISGSRLCVIRGSRHVPMLDRPEVLNRIILAFLAGHRVGE